MADADVQSIAAGEGNGESASAQNQEDGQASVATDGVKPADGWYESTITNDELRDKIRAKGFKNPDALAKSYFELDSKVGAPFHLPKPNAPPEVWDRFRTEVQKLERPESPDEYELDSLVLPKGVELKPNADSEFRTIAFNLGLSNEQARSLHKQTVAGLVDYVQDQRRKAEEARREGVSELRKAWGAEHYDENVAMVRRMIQDYGSDELVQLMNSGPGNEPAMLQFIYNMAKQLAEDTLVEGRPVPSGEQTAGEPRRTYPNSPQMTGGRRYARAT